MPLAFHPVASHLLPPPHVLLPIVAPWLDVAGLVVFAASGALAAARHGQTMVTLAFFALVTGVGGGTIRDLLIGAPVFWVHDGHVAGVCLVVAGAVWVSPHGWWRGAALDWFDAVGLAAYAVYGAAKALSYGVPPVPAALMGVLAASVGGIIRDMLAGEPSILMRPELYVTAAALASTSFVVLQRLGVPPPVAAGVAAAAGFGLRAAAIRWKLALPAYPSQRQGGPR
ncbi:MAG: trimeric intracellular cation channel family protein [Janthinobacterium lividum]